MPAFMQARCLLLWGTAHCMPMIVGVVAVCRVVSTVGCGQAERLCALLNLPSGISLQQRRRGSR